MKALGLVTVLAIFIPAATALAREQDPRLTTFLAERPRMAAALAEPVASCVARQDTRHPVFHGCIDWHSAVHGTWALIAYTRTTGDQRYRPLIERTLDPNRLAQERRDLAGDPHFEMPYGRAWFLRLAMDHHRTFHSDLLTPMADDIAESLIRYYTQNPPDPESTAYDNASWALINLHDYGQAHRNRRIVEWVKTMVRRHYLTREACPLQRVEIDQREFMAVCTNWAWLVQLVLPREEFNAWLARFLPADLPLTPVQAPANAHEVGLNFSRAWGLWRLYRATGNPRFLDSYLAHFQETYSRPALWKGDYRSVGHWVAQFGMFALTTSYDDAPPRTPVRSPP